MPNSNYRAGRDFEYRRKKAWEKEGYTVVRTAGSHGFADLIAFRVNEPVVTIQCKRTDKRSVANRLLRQFKDAPPFESSNWFRQVMEVYVKEDREVLSVSV